MDLEVQTVQTLLFVSHQFWWALRVQIDGLGFPVVVRMLKEAEFEAWFHWHKDAGLAVQTWDCSEHRSHGATEAWKFDSTWAQPPSTENRLCSQATDMSPNAKIEKRRATMFGVDWMVGGCTIFSEAVVVLQKPAIVFPSCSQFNTILSMHADCREDMPSCFPCFPGFDRSCRTWCVPKSPSNASHGFSLRV